MAESLRFLNRILEKYFTNKKIYGKLTIVDCGNFHIVNKHVSEYPSGAGYQFLEMETYGSR